MAHGFNNLGKNSTFASRRTKAWHGLGSVVNSMNSEEAMILGGLDFEVGLADLYIKGIRLPFPQGDDVIASYENNQIRYNEGKKVGTNFATYRKDTNDIFGVVGSRYEVIQNIEAFNFFDGIIGEGHAEYETVGALGNGETVFLTAKIPGDLVIGKENIEKYLLFTMAHDGSGSIQAMFTPIRVVCNNTLTAAVGTAKNKVSIRHTKNAQARLNQASKLLGIVDNQTTLMKEKFEHYSKKFINDKDVESIINHSFNINRQADGNYSTKSKNKLNSILKAYHTGVGQEGIIGSAWGVYNGITCYLQNHQTIKNQEDHFKKSFMGKDDIVRQKAMSEIDYFIR